jgi:hypothetical protein
MRVGYDFRASGQLFDEARVKRERQLAGLRERGAGCGHR